MVVLSNLIAIMLQTLAARLGLVTGKHLAQVGSHTGIQQMQKLPSSSRIAAQALAALLLTTSSMPSACPHVACPAAGVPRGVPPRCVLHAVGHVRDQHRGAGCHHGAG